MNRHERRKERAARRSRVKGVDDTIKREMERLTNLEEQAGKGFEEDRVFFEQHPERSHRLRLASANEIATFAVTGMAPPPSDLFWWVAVRRVRPGIRMRLGFTGPAPHFLDTSEASARRAYERCRVQP
jgi:hypothetical protein